MSFKNKFVQKGFFFFVNFISFKARLYQGIDFSTNADLGLDYCCLAFMKISEDMREWNWDKSM